MYASVFSLLGALVGGRWTNGLNCGLWYWNFNNASSNYNVNIGARPLILKNRDLMCACRCFAFWFLLLSAVGGRMVFIVACGIGTFTMRLRATMLSSELDYLSLNSLHIIFLSAC